QLEHPNIVPIHDIMVDADGRPIVVLKRIEGMAWSEAVNNPTLIAERYGAWNAIEWHTKIMLQVCQALRFAHSRNIIHRDVKPANVMIGTFDEVYLLDWGLAISIDDDDGRGRLPTPRNTPGAAGTPTYMAPEQFDEDPRRVGPHTDVYLVGATLFEAVVGRPPQSGNTLQEILDGILTRDEVLVPEHVPRELAAIINKAMAVKVEDRYPSIMALREALESFLQHRGSQDLVELAHERVTMMDAAHERRDEEVAERAFIEAVFGYRMALDTWRGNQEAHDHISAVVDRRVGQLLALKAPRAAQRALALVDAPDPALVERVNAEVEREQVERRRFDQLSRDDDRRVGLRTRRVLLIIFGALWVAGWTAVGLSPPTTLLPLLLGTALFCVLGIALVWQVRWEMLYVRLNRQIVWFVLLMMLAQLLLFGAFHLQQKPVSDALTTSMLLWAVALVFGAVAVDRRIVPVGLGYAAGFVICSYDPAQLRWVLAAGAVLTFANMLGINLAIARQVEAEARMPLAKPARRQLLDDEGEGG
ncbi:MAG: serine/threonine protein kinase, partial [Myxococcales bacterium]|nr:serine/threonine protein kinase [Myxococcales bacterium]